jgi:hypothetical protein
MPIVLIRISLITIMTCRKYPAQNPKESNRERAFSVEKTVLIKTAFICKKEKYPMSYLISRH